MNASTTGLATLLAFCFVAIRNEAAPFSSDAPNDAQSVFEVMQNGWRREFSRRGEHYIDARMTLYREHVESACGSVLAPGAYYCPLDRTLYLDLAADNMLHDRPDAGADGMQMHVIAHELSHHVQSLRGMTFGSLQRELHADCLAGIGFRLAGTKSEIALVDVESTMQVLHADSARTHGTAAQRLAALHRGQKSRSIFACDDFVTQQ